MIDQKIWDDQLEFNTLLRTNPVGTEDAICTFLKDRSLDLISEVDELLRTSSWKSHRRVTGHRPNRDHRLEELMDILKLTLTVAQGLGFTLQELEQVYWRKSAVCRQRYSEEWMKTLNCPAAVVDIDNVLCDYTVGFCNWIIYRAPLFAPAAQELIRQRAWFSGAADFGMSETEWQGFKHEFRSNGHKRFLPVMEGAQEFLQRLRTLDYRIILLTSRPIDRYPNLYSDTLFWLNASNLEYDWLWWSANKHECLIDHAAVKWVRFAVDDDPRHAQSFAQIKVPCFLLQTTTFSTKNVPTHPLIIPVRTLRDVVIPSLQGVK